VSCLARRIYLWERERKWRRREGFVARERVGIFEEVCRGLEEEILGVSHYDEVLVADLLYCEFHTHITVHFFYPPFYDGRKHPKSMENQTQTRIQTLHPPYHQPALDPEHLWKPPPLSSPPSNP
jgi:hypothetical protein